jgi:hypothetical protein
VDEPLLKTGTSLYEWVCYLQTHLQSEGFYDGEISGVFDDPTRMAVRRFQTHYGMLVDGVVGLQTWGGLIDRISVPPGIPPSPDPLPAEPACEPNVSIDPDELTSWPEVATGRPSMTFDVDRGVLAVDPDAPGRAAYEIAVTSGAEPHINDKASAHIPDTGPIPPGFYEANVAELSDPGGFGDWLRGWTGDWGDWRVPLVPLPGTETFGRDGFFLHGGSMAGSKGCIDVGGGDSGNEDTDRLLRDLRSHPEHRVPLHVF